MGPAERVQRTLRGARPDRPAVSFWHHFPAHQVYGPAAVAAHLAHLQAFDLDFLKVMNDNGYPRPGPIETAGDLASITELHGDEVEFTRQLDLIADLQRELRGRVLLTTTVFNSWATLRNLVRPPVEHHPPELQLADEPSRRILAFFTEDTPAVQTALQNIGATLARFAGQCLQAGANGIFLSVRDDWLQRPGDPRDLYDELVRPTDLQILEAAASGIFNVLHVCGKAVDFPSFAAYPVHALNWADRAAGPSIARVRGWLRPAICAGVDNLATLPEGTPGDCQREVADALRQAGERPIMITPGCTYDQDRVPRSNLAAVCSAAQQVAAPVAEPVSTGAGM